MRDSVPPGDGELRHVEDSFALRFERFLPHPVTTVWAALTESGRLAAWLAPGAIAPAPDGRGARSGLRMGTNKPGRASSLNSTSASPRRPRREERGRHAAAA